MMKTFEALLQEKQQLESNLRFFKDNHSEYDVYIVHGNQELSILPDEAEALIYRLVQRRKQRLEEINAIFTTIDTTLKEVHNKCQAHSEDASSAEK
ncbi:hypothetical protein D3C87_1016760 [compost metagenome]